MFEPKRDDQCIARWREGGPTEYLSVREYEHGMWRGPKLSIRARVFWGLVWTEDAPAVEDLTVEGAKTSEGWFRICDPQLYEQQMRAFVGLA